MQFSCNLHFFIIFIENPSVNNFVMVASSLNADVDRRLNIFVS